MNGILYVVTTGCTWKDVPHKYDSKSKETLGRPVNRPSKVTTDAMYDPKDIRKYNRKRGSKSNIPVNIIDRKRRKKGRPIKVVLAHPAASNEVYSRHRSKFR